ARAYAGRVVVADIGLVAASSGGAEASIELIDFRRVAERLASLPAAAHKGGRGHVGVVGGTGGTPGAAVLAGAAALRAGAGLATLAMTDEALRRALIETRPELMLADRDDRFVAAADVVVVGPGLTGPREGLSELDRDDPRSMVWDASALDDVSADRSAGPRILTPHPGEAARMLARLEGDASWTSARVQADRRDAARRLAEATAAVVVLKGEGTAVAGSMVSPPVAARARGACRRTRVGRRGCSRGSRATRAGPARGSRPIAATPPDDSPKRPPRWWCSRARARWWPSASASAIVCG